MPIKDNFPPAGSDYLGGTSDGWEYRTVFSGSNLEASYDMVRQFLKDEGYGDVPLPDTVEDLLLFKNPRPGGQYMLYTDRGYQHNPIKLFFHPYRNRTKTLILCIYDEAHPRHLLKFHGVE